MPTKTKEKLPLTKEKTLCEKVIDKFDTYTDTTDAIYEDYMCGDDGMFTEIAAADKNFRKAVEEILEDEAGISQVKVEEWLTESEDDIDYDSLLSKIDTDEVKDYLVSEGYAVIKVDNMADQAKLEEFVTTQLYPNYNDRDKYEL